MTGTTELTAFLTELPDLAPSELLRLAATQRSADHSALDRAHASARMVADRIGSAAQLADLQDKIIHWAEAQGAASGAGAGVATGAPLLLADARRQAVPALVDAGTALLLGDALDSTSRGVLTRAWGSLGRMSPASRRASGEGMRARRR